MDSQLSDRSDAAGYQYLRLRCNTCSRLRDFPCLLDCIDCNCSPLVKSFCQNSVIPGYRFVPSHFGMWESQSSRNHVAETHTYHTLTAGPNSRPGLPALVPATEIESYRSSAVWAKHASDCGSQPGLRDRTVRGPQPAARPRPPGPPAGPGAWSGIQRWAQAACQ